MAEQVLHGAAVMADLQQACDERMAQRKRTHRQQAARSMSPRNGSTSNHGNMRCVANLFLDPSSRRFFSSRRHSLAYALFGLLSGVIFCFAAGIEFRRSGRGTGALDSDAQPLIEGGRRRFSGGPSKACATCEVDHELVNYAAVGSSAPNQGQR
jgi:hypothetical protein